MFELADRLLAAVDDGRGIAVATAVSITGSAPRTVGTSMAVTDRGEVIGSISGGCVEGAVFELCQRVLATGRSEFAAYGFDDETAFAVGLSCGGRIEVVASPLDAGSPLVGPLRAAAAGRSASVTIPLGVDEREFTETAEPPARLLIVGAVEFSVALAAAASVVGYRVTVCDPRSVFATPERFPTAELVIDWPTEYLAGTVLDDRSVVCLLAHDDRFDVDVVELALASPAAFVGAMGSRRTNARRVAELTARGVVDLQRLHAPLGLDLGASTPEETAVAILAEVLAARNGASARPLVETVGAIHSAAARG